jgi:Branched-chain amino acid transport protein (AzlD)
MSAVWIVVAAVGAATMAIKAAGPMLLGGRELQPSALAVIRLLAPALLAALVVTQAVTVGDELVLDARLAGLAVALVALILRAPLLVVVAVAAATTAVVRLL